jgi:hypothetical protein
MAIDSGATNTFITPAKASTIGLKFTGPVEDEKACLWGKPVTISISSAVFDHVKPVIGVFGPLRAYPQLDGILGYDVLSRSSLEFDFDKMTLGICSDGDCSPFKDVKWLGSMGPVPAFYDLLKPRKPPELVFMSGRER